MNFKKTKIAKITSGIVGIATAIAMFGGAATAFAADDVAAQIAALMAQIQMLQAKLAGQTSTPAVGSYTFSTNLTLGSTGDDVMHLQQALNSDASTVVALSGNGSKGMETKYFGPATKAAVMKFQAKYGITPVAGYFGAISRAKMNSLMSTVVTTTGQTTTTTTTTTTTGGALVVAAAAQQPVNQLAPANATRIPFTKLTLTAGANDVAINGVVVERTGSSVDAVLSGVVLLDESGDQIGIAKTLNSSHRATVGDPLVIKAGTTRTFTIAGNRPAAGSNGGTVVALDVVGINTSATVSGDMFPIKGASHTVNETLVVGSVTVQRGGIDPGADQSKEIGTSGYVFSSVKVTAGSQESITLKSIRWNQTGSVGTGDIANLKTFVDGVSYDTTVSSDGKYYTANFGNGILMDKGFSKDISIKGDIVGGSNRTIIFDIAKRTDINLVGNTYGYGVLAPAGVVTTGVSAFYTGEDPWYNAATVTINAGTITVSSDNTVAAQNIAVNLANQPLGGWVVELRGEPISVGGMVFNVTAIGDQVANLTNVSLVDQDGRVLAGPVDGSGAAQSGTITFTDTVTFPIGTTRIVLKGKVGTTFVTNDTVKASTTPSTQWTSVRGQVTGNTIGALPSSAISGNQMTVKAGALAIGVSTQPVAQTVIAGAKQYEFARYTFDAGQSGEDLRITSIPLLLAVTTVSATDITNCQLYDGSLSVTTGSNVKNPSAVGDNTFTFDNTGLMIPKGTMKTLSLRCDLSGSASSGTVTWGLAGTDITSVSGLTSGQTIAETQTAAAGQAMVASASGSYSVSTNTSGAYNYRAVKAGTSVVLGAFDFTASISENLNLRQIALQLSNVASNSPADLVGQQVTIWNGSNQVGVASFGGSNPDNATSSLTTSVLIPKGETVTLVMKGDLVGHDQVNGTPGAFLTVDYDGNNNGLNGNYATGVDSGSTITPTSGDSSTAGIRIFRTVPTFTIVSNGGTFVNNGDTYKFTVTNPDSQKGLVLYKLTFSVATTGVATDFTLYEASSNAAINATPVQAIGATGAQTVSITFDAGDNRIVSANSSKTFVLRVANIVDTGSVSETLALALKADTSYPSLTYKMGTVGQLSASRVIWSPVSTTSPVTGAATAEDNLDWTNGYGLPGFPSAGDFPIQVWTRAN